MSATQTPEPLTTTLRGGAVVLARPMAGYGPYPVTYANRTQAERAVAKLGAGWFVAHIGRPFFVAKAGAL